MRGRAIGLLAALLTVCGCHQSPEAAGPRSQGRFAGIGVFDAGRLWAQMVGSGSTNDATAARIADDEHIIVVLDSHTGEVRQCGDHSGYCVTMNRWKSSQSTLPVKLSKHASDLAAADEAETAKPTHSK